MGAAAAVAAGSGGEDDRACRGFGQSAWQAHSAPQRRARNSGTCRHVLVDVDPADARRVVGRRHGMFRRRERRRIARWHGRRRRRPHSSCRSDSRTVRGVAPSVARDGGARPRPARGGPRPDRGGQQAMGDAVRAEGDAVLRHLAHLRPRHERVRRSPAGEPRRASRRPRQRRRAVDAAVLPALHGVASRRSGRDRPGSSVEARQAVERAAGARLAQTGVGTAACSHGPGQQAVQALLPEHVGRCR